MGFRPQFAFSIPRAGPCASGSFAEPAPVRGSKYVDMLGGAEVATPFYLVGRAGGGGQGTGSALMGAPKCRDHTIARVAPLDSVSQIPFVQTRNAPPPRAHSLGSLSRCGRRCLGSLGVVCSVLWCARFARSPNNGAHFKSQVSRFCCRFSLWGGAPRRLSRPRGRTCSKTERRLLCVCYAPTSSPSACQTCLQLCAGAHGAAQTYGRGCSLGFDELHLKGARAPFDGFQ